MRLHVWSDLLEPVRGFLTFAYVPGYTLIGYLVCSVCVVCLMTVCVPQSKYV